MDTESFILSVRERRPVWDQLLPEHHNRYILDRLWKEISKENNCSVKEAQKKWKGIRDYYKSEFRKTQKERSGQGADTVYKPNWPYFMSLDFLREQFQARPSSGNLTVSEQRAEKRKADVTGITEVSDNNPDSPNNEKDENNGTDETPNENIPSVASPSTNNETRTFIHTNDFRKRKGRQDQIQKLVQLEEKKLSILEEKKRKEQEKEKERNKTTDDEDLKFFESLKPHLKLITGINKLMFRNDVQSLVMKYSYCSREFDSSSRSTTVSGHSSLSGSRAQTSVCESPYTLYNLGDVTGTEAGVEEIWSDNMSNN